jgi:hypothetical protein
MKKTANGETTRGRAGQEDHDEDQPGVERHCSSVSSIFERLSLKKLLNIYIPEQI